MALIWTLCSSCGCPRTLSSVDTLLPKLLLGELRVRDAGRGVGEAV